MTDGKEKFKDALRSLVYVMVAMGMFVFYLFTRLFGGKTRRKRR